MKNILVLTGSPRRQGNSDMLAEAFIKGAAAAGHQAGRFDAARHHIGGCRACGACFSTDTACVQRDGFTELEPLLEKADALVLCTPLYWFSLSAQIKAAIDRLYAYQSEQCTRPLHIAESALIICGADDGTASFTGAVETYKGIAGYMEWTDRGVLIVSNVADKGDVRNTGALAEAEKLGREF